ncbi:hypothetical protein HERIO_2275 [Hepatospora eriocheir]|uniref:Uncharacterized protein n=1 Tax=Hepatospora eriocheir TaxID=1081669 RepID=A0A1X0Q7F6_9MICR|nr:hypothetical protein HERIO_2275 [Hepatospora eriocheir]
MKFFKLIRFVVGSDLEKVGDSSDNENKPLIEKELIKQNPILEKKEIDLTNQRTEITDQKLKKEEISQLRKQLKYLEIKIKFLVNENNNKSKLISEDVYFIREGKKKLKETCV